MPLDPRPELEADSATWAKLLTLAYELDESDMDGAYGALLGIRCMGAQIGQVNGKQGLVPGEIPESEWLAIRKRYLLPNTAKIMELLGRLS